MSIKRITTWLLGLAAVCMVLTAPVSAQRNVHRIPPHINPNGNIPDLTQPFIDPDTFHSDFQFFAPAELGDFGEIPDAKTGWFASYDRLYIWVTRPDPAINGAVTLPGGIVVGPDNNQTPWTIQSQGATEGDFTWANRVEIGYMTEANHGWFVTGFHMNGPNEDGGFVDLINTNGLSPHLLAERNNRVNNMMGEILPVADRNNRLTGARDFVMLQSTNVADLSGFEFNKSFRLKPMHYGSVFEPFLGFRYYKFIDYFRRTNYRRLDMMGNVVPILPPPLANTAMIEQFTQDFSSFTNHMVGGQLGVRWHKQKGRWTLASQFRMFGAQNFQAYNFQRDRITTVVAQMNNATPSTERRERFTDKANRAEFTWGGEVRAIAAFELTRDISCHFGADVMYYGMGIARGVDPNFNDQNLIMVGSHFGLTYNR